MSIKKVALFFSIASSVASASLAFEPLSDTRLDYPVGSYPGSIAAADLGVDGNPDLAAAICSDTLSILENNGDGTFAGAVDYALDGSPQSVVASDFDGDGRLDLPAANLDAVSILKNTGNGTFGSATHYGVSGSTSICAAEFDGDGRQDLAVLSRFAGTVSILTNLNGGRSCFTGTTGNVDGSFSGLVDIASAFAIVDYLLAGMSLSDCHTEDDVNSDWADDISDLFAIIDYLSSAVELPACM